MDPVESTDFDFFDTPRHQDNKDSDDEFDKTDTKPQNVHSKAKIVNSDNTKDRKAVSDKSDKRRPSSSLSESSEGEDVDYSSDSVTSVSDSQSDKDKSEKSPVTKKSQRASSSDSSGASSSYRRKNKDSIRSPQSRARKRSDSKSDDNSSDDDSSYSGRRLKTRMSNRDSKKATRKANKESKRKQSDADSYSSSAYSDGEESSHRVSSLNHSDHDKRSGSQSNGGSKRQQAWGMESNKDAEKSGGKKATNARPKTAKKRTDYNKHRPNSPPPRSDSDALSESDITDVSPMESPRLDNKSRNRSKTSLSGIGAAGDGSNVKSQFRALPLSEKDLENEEDFDEDQVNSTGIDLNILMKAVGELEKKKRVEANSRRVMFAPMTLKRNDKSNFTFTRDKTNDIDRENDRLLKEIVKQVHADRKKQYHQNPTTTKYKLTPSAINREKEMKRIESDNINFLKRLQKVKATSTISRSHQLREYENTKLHGIPISTLHPMSRASSRASQLTDSFSSIGSRTRSLSSLHSVASTVRSTSSKRSSRPGSATKRIDHRPEWNDRW